MCLISSIILFLNSLLLSDKYYFGPTAPIDDPSVKKCLSLQFCSILLIFHWIRRHQLRKVVCARNSIAISGCRSFCLVDIDPYDLIWFYHLKWRQWGYYRFAWIVHETWFALFGPLMDIFYHFRPERLPF